MLLRFVLFFTICFISFEANGQLLPGDVKSNTIKPRENNDGLAGAYYAGFGFKSVKTINEWGLDFGGSFGGMVSDHFSIGMSLYSLITQNVRILPEKPYFLRIIYGGLEPMFMFKAGDFVFRTKVLLGMGFASYSENVNLDVLSDMNGDWIMVGEPSLGISYIADESIWIEIDAGMRATGGVDFKNIASADLNGPFIAVSLRTLIY